VQRNLRVQISDGEWHMPAVLILEVNRNMEGLPRSTVTLSKPNDSHLGISSKSNILERGITSLVRQIPAMVT